MLITHPGVLMSRCSAPNEEMGEEVGAAQQPHDMAKGARNSAELILFCRKHLSPIKCPRASTSRPSCRARPLASW